MKIVNKKQNIDTLVMFLDSGVKDFKWKLKFYKFIELEIIILIEIC
jgi:hypothetical protein